jgi:hypothetical protein
VMMAAINSRMFMEALPWRLVGRQYLQAWPCVVYQPMPHSQASEYVTAEGEVRQILLMLMPVCDRCWRKNVQSFRSLISHGNSLICLFLQKVLYWLRRYLSQVRK